MTQKPKSALSIKQPWAWLIAAGKKDVENRNWSSSFTGRIWIHASQTPDTKEGFKAAADIIRRIYPPTAAAVIEDYLTSVCGTVCGGAIIGEATVTGCVEKSDSPWFCGKYGFTLSDAVLYDTPIPCKGALGFFQPKFEEAK